MKICFPVLNDAGMESFVYGHFCTAPLFQVLDSRTCRVTKIANVGGKANDNCGVEGTLGGRKVDAIVVGGIDDGALKMCLDMGMKVFRAQGNTVEANYRLIKQGRLSQYTMKHSL